MAPTDPAAPRRRFDGPPVVVSLFSASPCLECSRRARPRVCSNRPDIKRMLCCQHALRFSVFCTPHTQLCTPSHSVAGNVLRTARLKPYAYSNAALEPWYTLERGFRAMVRIRTRGSNHGTYSNAAFEPWYTVERRVLSIGNLRMSRSTVNTASPRVSNATVTTRCSRRCSSAMF